MFDPYTNISAFNIRADFDALDAGNLTVSPANQSLSLRYTIAPTTPNVAGVVSTLNPYLRNLDYLNELQCFLPNRPAG